MFSQVSVILSGGEVYTPPQADNSHPETATAADGTHPTLIQMNHS